MRPDKNRRIGHHGRSLLSKGANIVAPLLKSAPWPEIRVAELNPLLHRTEQSRERRVLVESLLVRAG